MGLSREQIEEWSKRPPSFFLDWTRTVLTEALDGAPQLEGKCDYEIYAQGSYANETNVDPNGDVDLVVQMRLPFEEEITLLSEPDEKRFWDKYGDAAYRLPQFRADVIDRLRENFFVKESNKCLDIQHFDSPMRLPADIVPAIEHRTYSGFPAPDVEYYTEGIFFRTLEGRVVVNYPKQHLRNGKRKDAATDRGFKPVVRVFKNAVKHTAVEPGDAPSYFIECLVCNVDNSVFQRPVHEAYPACVRWLDDHRGDFGGYLCQNGLVPLFNGQWTTGLAGDLIDALKAQLAG